MLGHALTTGQLAKLRITGSNLVDVISVDGRQVARGGQLVPILQNGPDVFRMAEAPTRNTSETNVFHNGPMAGLGARHNVVKWGDGAKEARISQAVHWRPDYHLSTDEGTGDIMSEQLKSDLVIIKHDPMRMTQPVLSQKPRYPDRLWKRSGDTECRDRVNAGVDGMLAMPYCLRSGVRNGLNPLLKKGEIGPLRGVGSTTVGYDPVTGELSPNLDTKVGKPVPPSFRNTLLTRIALCSLVGVISAAHAALPPLPPLPSLPAPLPVDSVPLGVSSSAPEVQLDLPIASGPFQPSWASIEKNYPGTPAWLREAKFGIWVHFGPQAAGLSGDWYARKMYSPGTTAYDNHLQAFGHPSEFGYKEILRDWNPRQLDPAKLTALYKEAGARFMLIQGVHHDNFDLWDSRYQPWNSTRMGPRRDLLDEWAKAAKAAGIRYGVAFHHEYSWWWWQTAFGSDTKGRLAGVPYDAQLTLADGKGKWWEGLDPRLLYNVDLRQYQGVTRAANSPWNPPPDGIFSRHAEYAKWYATRWALRMMDVVEHYDPDFIYTDGTGPQPFSGDHTGTGIKTDAMQRVIADFYNRSLASRGKVDTFSIVKFRSNTNGTVNTEEGTIPAGIKTDQAWIAENPVGDWYYRPGFTNDSGAVIRYILEQVARDGNVAICISPLPDGSLDDSTVRMLKEIGAWMRVNGEGIYGSKAWLRLGEGEGGKLRTLPSGKLGNKQADFVFGPHDFRFTVGKDGSLYAFALAVPAPGSTVKIVSLGSAAGLLGKPVSSVTLVGHQGAPLSWKQEGNALLIICPDTMPFSTAVAFQIR